jgi:purine-cytosine permease-like protein
LDRLYGAIIPSVLNVLSSQGFLIVNCIIGGQALAVASNKLDDKLGIIIIGVISLVVPLEICPFLHLDNDPTLAVHR